MRILSFDVGIRNLALAIIGFSGQAASSGKEQKMDNESENQEATTVAEENLWHKVILEHWECIDVLQECGCEAKNSKRIPIDKCIQFIGQILWKRRDIFFSQPIDYVLIEKQVKQSPRNLMTQVGIMCFFTNYFLFQKETQVQTQSTPKICLVPAKNKMQVNLDPNSFLFAVHHNRPFHHINDASLTSAQNKTRRKKKAVELAKLIIQERLCPSEKEKWSSHLVHKKKDDEADCLIQGLWFIQDKLGKKFKKLVKKRKRSSE